MIEFLCPEGHKIRCPEEKAGRPAKCPRCGVGFRIPTIEELGLGESTVADASGVGEEVSDASLAPSSPRLSGRADSDTSAPVAPTKERQIEFLCPNGHHLHGPASLQGRAGECPECGSRFRIPVIDDPDTGAPGDPGAAAEPGASAEDEIRLENPTMEAESGHVESSEPLDFLQVESGRFESAKPTGGAEQPIPDSAPGPNGTQPTAHPLAALFIELWAARGEGSRVEIHLESGSVLLPDGYLKSHSQQDYAVLVTKDPDGCSTVTVVPWNSISRIILRAVREVPGEVVR